MSVQPEIAPSNTAPLIQELTDPSRLARIARDNDIHKCITLSDDPGPDGDFHPSDTQVTTALLALIGAVHHDSEDSINDVARTVDRLQVIPAMRYGEFGGRECWHF